MFTVDASVYINALNPNEAHSAESQRFLARVHRQRVTVFSQYRKSCYELSIGGRAFHRCSSCLSWA